MKRRITRFFTKSIPTTAADIERIVVHASQVTLDHAGWAYRPEGLTGAQLNLAFCAATLILEGDAFVEQFTVDCVNDRARIELARKVQVVHDPAITALGAAHRHQVRVEVQFRDGGIECEMRDAPRGSEENFADEAQIIGKFRKLTRAAMPEQQQNALIEAVLRLEHLPDCRAMLEALRVV